MSTLKEGVVVVLLLLGYFVGVPELLGTQIVQSWNLPIISNPSYPIQVTESRILVLLDLWGCPTCCNPMAPRGSSGCPWDTTTTMTTATTNWEGETTTITTAATTPIPELPPFLSPLILFTVLFLAVTILRRTRIGTQQPTIAEGVAHFLIEW